MYMIDRRDGLISCLKPRIILGSKSWRKVTGEKLNNVIDSISWTKTDAVVYCKEFKVEVYTVYTRNLSPSISLSK